MSRMFVTLLLLSAVIFVASIAVSARRTEGEFKDGLDRRNYRSKRNKYFSLVKVCPNISIVSYNP